MILTIGHRINSLLSFFFGYSKRVYDCYLQKSKVRTRLYTSNNYLIWIPKNESLFSKEIGLVLNKVF